MGFADIRSQVRQMVHDTFAGLVSYRAPDGTVTTHSTANPLTARWGNKLAAGGNGDIGGEYSGVIEGIDRLRFRKDQLAAHGVTLKKNGVVTLTEYGRAFTLDVLLPDDGPVTQTWLVVDYAAG